jgi:hypothetical protein
VVPQLSNYCFFRKTAIAVGWLRAETGFDAKTVTVGRDAGRNAGVGKLGCLYGRERF